MNRPYRESLLRNTMGFLTCEGDEEELMKEDRLQPVLVRCGGGRFTCPIQDLAHFRDIINADGRDYIRDASVQS